MVTTSSTLLTHILFPVQASSYTAESFPDELIWIPRDAVVSEDASGDGDVPCLLFQCPSARFLLIFFHGNAEDLGRCHSWCSYLREQFQVHVLAVEYPGYGICPGIPTSETVMANSLAAVRFATDVLGWQLDSIKVFGRSIGTGPAIRLASLYSFAGLILVTPFLSVQELIRERVGPIAGLFDEWFCNKDLAPKISSPTLVIHGQRDELIAFRHSEALFALIRSRKLLVSPPSMEHNTNLLVNSQVFVVPMFNFFSLPDYSFQEMRVPSWAFHRGRAGSLGDSRVVLEEEESKIEPTDLLLTPMGDSSEWPGHAATIMAERLVEVPGEVGRQFASGGRHLAIGPVTREALRKLEDFAEKLCVEEICSDKLYVPSDKFTCDNLPQPSDEPAKVEPPPATVVNVDEVLSMCPLRKASDGSCCTKLEQELSTESSLGLRRGTSMFADLDVPCKLSAQVRPPGTRLLPGRTLTDDKAAACWPVTPVGKASDDSLVGRASRNFKRHQVERMVSAPVGTGTDLTFRSAFLGWCSRGFLQEEEEVEVISDAQHAGVAPGTDVCSSGAAASTEQRREQVGFRRLGPSNLERSQCQARRSGGVEKSLPKDFLARRPDENVDFLEHICMNRARGMANAKAPPVSYRSAEAGPQSRTLAQRLAKVPPQGVTRGGGMSSRIPANVSSTPEHLPGKLGAVRLPSRQTDVQDRTDSHSPPARARVPEARTTPSPALQSRGSKPVLTQPAASASSIRANSDAVAT